MLPVFQAYAEGKEIEILVNGKYYRVLEICNGMNPKDYRINPESEYRPFKDAIECWTEMHKHKPFSILKDKKDGHRVQILSISDGINLISSSPDSNLCYDFKHRMDLCTFDDGAPFGIKVGE